MKYKFVYRPFVKQDLKQATNYYKAISTSLAKDFLFRIREAKKYIALNIEGDDVMYKDVRMHNMYQFPYHIHYYIDKENKQVVILSVAFSKRENLNFTERK
jgi:mRNA-degrading endonuclease RelE of RelBE toxin-antitoxin system